MDPDLWTAEEAAARARVVVPPLAASGPNYPALAAYMQTLSREGRRYALALRDYYRDELAGRRGANPEPYRPKSPIVHTRVANMVRHLLVGDCDERGTRIERRPAPAVEIATTAPPLVSGKCAQCGWPLDERGRCLTDSRHGTAL